MLDRLMVWLGIHDPKPEDPEKVSVRQRLLRLEKRVTLVEDWQKSEQAIRRTRP
jgi:hypothetical protein